MFSNHSSWKGSKGVMASYNRVEFDFNELDVEDLQDSAHQVITKKITNAEKINFSKEKRKKRG